MGWSSWGSGRKRVEVVSLVWVPEASRSGPSPSSGPSSSSLQIPFSKSECWSFTAGRFLCTWASRGSKRKGAMIVQREDFARAVRFWLPSAGVRRLWNTCRNSATYCEWTQSLFHLSHRTFQILSSVTLWIFCFLLTNQFLSTLSPSKIQTAAAGEGQLWVSHLHPPQTDGAENGAALQGGVRVLLPGQLPGGESGDTDHTTQGSDQDQGLILTPR